MMCTMDETILQTYLDGELALHERWICEEHLSLCSQCRRTLNQLKVLDWNLQHLEIPVPNELEQLRQETVAAAVNAATTSTMDLRSYYRLQASVWERSLAFVQLIPASRLMGRASRKARLRWKRPATSFRQRISQALRDRISGM